MQFGRHTALPAVCSLSLTGSQHFSHCWPLPASVPKNKPEETLKHGYEVIYKLRATSRLSLSVSGALISAETPLISVRVQLLSTRLFTGITLNFITDSAAATHAPNCHADTIGLVSKVLMGFRGEGEAGGYRHDILITSLAQTTSSQFYLSHQRKKQHAASEQPASICPHSFNLFIKIFVFRS